MCWDITLFMGCALADSHLCPNGGEQEYGPQTENARVLHCYRFDCKPIRECAILWTISLSQADEHQTLSW